MQKMDSKGHRPAAQAQYKRLLNKVGEITSALLGANNRRPFLAKTFLMVQTRRDKADAS